MDAIFERVSVREFEDRPIEEDKVEQLLRAAMAAPSAGNQRPWEFYVVTNADVRAALAQATPFAKPAGRAPLVIVSCMINEGLVFPSCSPQDMSAATENILLEAAALGLGAVWLGVAPERDRMDAVAQAIGAPSKFEPFAMIAVGYPAEGALRPQQDRFDPARVHVVS